MTKKTQCLTCYAKNDIGCVLQKTPPITSKKCEYRPNSVKSTIESFKIEIPKLGIDVINDFQANTKLALLLIEYLLDFQEFRKDIIFSIQKSTKKSGTISDKQFQVVKQLVLFKHKSYDKHKSL